MEKRKYYLAYGSNLNLAQMTWRCPNARIAGVATLEDYRLLFRGSGTGFFLTVEPCLGASVPCGVWEITAEDEKRLDCYEGFPKFYYKRMLPVRIESHAFDRDLEADAMIYIMHEDRPIGVPSQLYLSICGEGYLDWGFDLQHLEDALAFVRREVRSR